MWKVIVPGRVLPTSSRVSSRSFSHSNPPTGLAKAQKKPTHRKAERKPLSYSRPKNSKTVLSVRSATVFYPPGQSQEDIDQPTMGKKKNKHQARLDQPTPPSSDHYPLRSRGLKPDLTAPLDFSANGSEQPQSLSYQPPYQWPAASGELNPNGDFNPQMPQMFNGMNMLNMAMAQPDFFTGLQPMQMPFFTPSYMSMGFNTPQTSLPAQGIPMTFPQNNINPSTPPFNTGMNSPPSTVNPELERRPITAPSAASGGIPDPTPAYTIRASFLPKRREYPGPLLVVIDLNGTLLHRPDRRHGSRFQARQHAETFVNYCVETFWVVIWSSARPENVRRMVDQLLTPESRRQVVAVWGRDRFGLTEADYNARTQCYKRLTTLWDDPLVKSAYPRTRPGFEGGFWNQSNTVLIDDSAEKARSEPHNAITLPSFTGGADVAADVLPSVHDYLNELCYQEDVSAYMRANPFKMA